MRSFRNRKRAVFATAFFAISSFALAPGVIHHGHSVATALEHVQPKLQEPSTRLLPPHFRLTLPEPDYTMPTVPLQAPAIAGAGAPDLEIIADNGRMIANIRPQWFDNASRGSSAHGSRAATNTSTGAIAVNATPRQTFAAPQERDPEATPADEKPATEETAPEQTELADNNLPGADELHNPINAPGTPDDTKPGSNHTVAVPEPSAFALLAVGLIGLALSRRRQR